MAQRRVPSAQAVEDAVKKVLQREESMSFSEFVGALARVLKPMTADHILAWLALHGEDITVSCKKVGTSGISKQQQARREQGVDAHKLNAEEFITLAIEQLRDPGFKSIHTVYSGFNNAFRRYFDGDELDPIVEVERLVEEGKLSRRFTKGGALISSDPSFVTTDEVTVLKKMGITKAR